MKNFTILFQLILIIFFACACTKAKSTKWINGDVQVRSSVTNEPVDATLEIRYHLEDKYYDFNTFDVQEIGTTTNGYYYIEQEFLGKVKLADLMVYGEGYYSIPGQKTLRKIYENLSIKRKFDAEIFIDPVYRANFHLKNTSCYDATDTVWLSYNPSGSSDDTTVFFTGCMDEEVDVLPYWFLSDTYSFWITSKKNGIVTETGAGDYLIPETINEVVIEY